jgi:hypothetical protein
VFGRPPNKRSDGAAKFGALGHDAYFSPEKPVAEMTKASSIFIFILVAIDSLIHNKTRNTGM